VALCCGGEVMVLLYNIVVLWWFCLGSV